jgi:hypothetical protein
MLGKESQGTRSVRWLATASSLTSKFPQPHIQWQTLRLAVYLMLNRPERKADHLFPFRYVSVTWQNTRITGYFTLFWDDGEKKKNKNKTEEVEDQE